jgi:hypothetical protein
MYMVEKCSNCHCILGIESYELKCLHKFCKPCFLCLNLDECNKCNIHINNTNFDIQKQICICPIHNYNYLSNVYCFFHRIRLCSLCLNCHLSLQCNIRRWNDDDTNILKNQIMMKLVKITDETKNLINDLNDGIYDIFSFHEEINNKYNIVNNLEFNMFIETELSCSAMSYNEFIYLAKILFSHNIISNYKDLKYLENNYIKKLSIHELKYILNNYSEILIRGEKGKNNSKYYVRTIKFKQNNNLVFFDNVYLYVDTKDEIPYLKINDEIVYIFEIFLINNIFSVIQDKNFDVLYYNDKYFVFDFVNFIEIFDNFLRIEIICNEKNINIYIKINKKNNDFWSDYILIDNPFHFIKTETIVKYKKEIYLKGLSISEILIIYNGIATIRFDDCKLKGKIESILYFRIKNLI